MDLGGLGGLNGVGSRLQMLMLMPSDAGAVAVADDDAVVGVVVVAVVVVVLVLRVYQRGRVIFVEGWLSSISI